MSENTLNSISGKLPTINVGVLHGSLIDPTLFLKCIKELPSVML